MDKKDFYYDLPESFIAQHPVEPRDSSRLLVYHRNDGTMEHRHFYDLCDYLRPGDVLVINESRVIPARLIGVREDTGGKIEFLLLKRLSGDEWETLVKPGRRAKLGTTVSFGNGELRAEILEKTDDGGRIVRFAYEGVFEEVLDRLGQMPLPPYITAKLEDRERYQTVYSKEKGSAAAPTAGLHFTTELMERVRAMGVEFVPVVLHVGLGTFRPVKEDDITRHPMHTESYTISAENARRINEARKRGGRVISVGTTSMRVLETVADEKGELRASSGETSIFIYPGYRFKIVDALITNFHLPESTLLMLVSAFMGREQALAMYETAKKEGYRFFSFGDATFLI
ncbi:MAG: tRNA preQ1(34) S-adenosylmethionine ribosyltransferase-isomerase QueA [Eubacteriales bacterium]|nr:tRNA preQ1(34) S-adenosylmethionine ribosyltransferase-isomerase QueA [Eubacteriales bacterium]